MSKTLDQWLNSSSSSSDDSTTPVSKPKPAQRVQSFSNSSSTGLPPRSTDSPTSIRRKSPSGSTTSGAPTSAVAGKVVSSEAEERRKKIEEMRNRMKNVLGDAVVEKVTSSVNVRDSLNSAYSNDFVSDDGAPSPNQSLPAHLPPLSGRAGMDDLTGRNLLGNMRLEEVETTVVDRGCQTICEVECQTDPDPVIAGCAMCYKQTYGHTHANFFGCGHQGGGGGPSSSAALGGGGCGGGGGTAMITGDPYFERLLQRAELLGAAASMGNGGGFGYRSPAAAASQFQHQPYRAAAPHHQHPSSHHYNSGSTAVGGGWKDQLGFLEGSIDMLINRYNLPPPPGMEHLRPR